MKAVRCQSAKCNGGVGTLAARMRSVLGYAAVVLPDGTPYLIAQPSSFPFVAKCASCRRPSKYTSAEFRLLPNLTVGQLASLGALDALCKDWVGAGLPLENAVDMVAIGVHGPATIEEMNESAKSTEEAEQRRAAARATREANRQ